MAIERDTLRRRRRPRCRERHAEDRVRPQLGLVRSAVEIDQRLVEAALVRRVPALDHGRDRPLDVLHRFPHALPAIALAVAVPELDGLVSAGRRTRRDHRGSARSAAERYVDGHSRIPPRIEDLAGGDGHDRRVGHRSGIAATPGRVLPSISSSDAPPPVETCVILSARPASSTAWTDSPPPTTVVAELWAMSSPMPRAPLPTTRAPTPPRRPHPKKGLSGGPPRATAVTAWRALSSQP